MGRFDLGQELRPQGREKAFLFAFAFRRVGRRVDAPDAQRRAGGAELGGGIDLAVVHIERLGQAAAQDGELEDAFQAGQRLVEEEFGVGYQAAMVVDEAKQVRAALLARLDRGPAATVRPARRPARAR